MSKPVRSRRLIALFAAYVVALQGFLLPLTVAAFAAPESVLCTATGATHQPANADGGCACAAGCGMQCGTPSLAGPSPQGVIVLRTTQSLLVAPLTVTLVVVPPREENPHSPRAPPFV